MSSKQRTSRPARYTLDISRPGHTPKKFPCPNCNKKRFVRFIDQETGGYLAGDFGRCDREEHCGYFLSPYQAGGISQDLTTYSANRYTPPPAAAKLSKHVPRDLVSRSLQAYDNNILIKFITSIVGADHTAAALRRYFVGTARDGATIFWQLDRTMQVRTGVKTLYKPDGHRDKSADISRLGFTVGNGHFSCLFGEHLLYTQSDTAPVILVESEKTAFIASIYLPRLNGVPVLWMACSGANGLTDEKIQVLAGKEVILCPDFSFHARATWGLLPMRKKANEKNVLVPDPSGELQPDFVPASVKLARVGAAVKFFDPAPHISDASDIADLLIASGPPAPLYEPPDFGQLELSLDPPAENRAISQPLAPISADRGESRLTHTTAPRAFRIARNENGSFAPLMDGETGADVIREFLNRPLIAQLIEGLEFVSGEIVPEDWDEDKFQPPKDFKARCLEVKGPSPYLG